MCPKKQCCSILFTVIYTPLTHFHQPTASTLPASAPSICPPPPCPPFVPHTTPHHTVLCTTLHHHMTPNYTPPHQATRSPSPHARTLANVYLPAQPRADPNNPTPHHHLTATPRVPLSTKAIQCCLVAHSNTLGRT